MVDDQSTLAPRRLQALMCTFLNQPRAIVLSKPHKPRACVTCFHAQKSVTISITLLCRLRRFHHRLLYQSTCIDPSDHLVQPSRSCPTAMTRSRLPNRLTNFHPSHDNSILAYMTSRNAFKHPCCATKIFTLVWHNPRCSVPLNFSISNLVPVGFMVLCMTDP